MTTEQWLALCGIVVLFSAVGLLAFIWDQIRQVRHRLGQMRFEIYRIAQAADRFESDHRPERPSIAPQKRPEL